jgi:YHS domain-containing protein
MEGSDEHTLEVDGRTVRFCSAGCRETFEQQRAGRGDWRDVLTSRGGWYRLANRYRKEWSMIWKDVLAGFLISGFVIVFVPQTVWNTLFLEGGSVWAAAENAFMGVAVAVVSFVGSIGNVPFAVALWGGGVSFAGVIAFIYSDLITIPVLNVYRKYYGRRVMLYIFVVFFVTMATSGFLMEQLFSALHIVPEVVEGENASARSYFALDYTFWLNLVAVGLSGTLYGMYRRGLGAADGDRDAVCGMGVDDDAPTAEVDGQVYRFCSESCRRKFERSPGRYVSG